MSSSDPTPEWLGWLRRQTQSKETFVQITTALYWFPFTGLMLWTVGDFGGIWWWAVVIVVCFAASWVFALGMWAALKDNFQKDESPQS